MPFHPFQALPLTMSCRVASWTTISLAEPPPPACIRTYGPAAFLCPVYRTLSNDADPTRDEEEFREIGVFRGHVGITICGATPFKFLNCSLGNSGDTRF